MTSPVSPASAAISSFLDSIALAPRQSHKLLTIWPLLRTSPAAGAPYVSLAEALARDEVEISELPGGASVPHILVTNRGEVAVLALFGEELRGAFQNRTANASFLIPPHGSVQIDVSCVEQGRWSSRAGQDALRFRTSGHVLSHALRAKMARNVAVAQKRGRAFDAGQCEVWSEVADRVSYARASAPTGSYEDYVDTRARDLDEASAAFATLPEQVGFVASLGDEVVGLEAIGRPEVFAKAAPGLLRAYLIDAIDAALVREPRRPSSDAASSTPRFDSPEAFLAALREAPGEARPSLGIGTDVRVAGEGVCACALVDADVVHVTAFPAVPESRRSGARAEDLDDGWDGGDDFLRRPDDASEAWAARPRRSRRRA
jgi:hypothetical protein